MKVIFFLMLIFTLTVTQTHAQTKHSALSACITDDIFLKAAGHQPLLVFRKISSHNINVLLTTKPPILWKYINSTFHTQNNRDIRKIFSQSTSEHLIAVPKPKNVYLINKVYSQSSARAFETKLTARGASIIDELLILVNDSQDKCIVFYHIINEGSSVVMLERRDGTWSVVSVKNETLE